LDGSKLNVTLNSIFKKDNQMIDIKRSFAQHVDVLPLAMGASVTDEGQGMIAVLEDGIEKVKPSAGAANEVFAGFAHFRTVNDTTTKPVVEEATVPAAAAYVVELAHNNLIAGQIRVYDVAGDADLTLVVGAPAAGEYSLDAVSGTVTFNAAEAGRAMVVYYRYNLTVAESKMYYYEAPTNYPDANLFQTVGVYKGKGRIFTSLYNQAIDWSATGLTIRLGANGILTAAGSGAVVPGARVVKVPGTGIGNEMLGIEFLA